MERQKLQALSEKLLEKENASVVDEVNLQKALFTRRVK